MVQFVYIRLACLIHYVILSLGPRVLLFAVKSILYVIHVVCSLLCFFLRLGADGIGESASSSLSRDSVIIVSAVLPSLVVVLLVSGAAVYWAVKRLRQKSKSSGILTSSSHQQ